MFDYILFGIVDNGIMLIGAFFGLGVEQYLPKKFQVGLGAVIGAGIGNAVSDFLGGFASLNMSLAFGTFIGCIIGLLFIPIFYKLKNNFK
tara:strand:+ start:618 stop:887 length:270 start_codon:yes stop_codon:yes gene_type:complete